MKDEAFEELLTSVRQAGRIRRGEARASRRTSYRPADVKAIRTKLGQTQAAFAQMIGVSVATLRRKIESDAANPQYILTVWGTGYKFADV